MTKISSPFRMKVLRKIGVSLWPWRHMTLKQVEKLDKIVQKNSKQTSLLERKKKRTQFAYQLQAKQIVKALYGNLNTSYFISLYKKSLKMIGKSNINFFSQLERRLDCILYRANFVTSFQEARQVISHQKVCVNTVKINKPGYIVKPGDIISFVPDIKDTQAQSITNFLNRPATIKALNDKGSLQSKNNRAFSPTKVFYKPVHLEINYHTLTIVYLYTPQQLYYPVQLPLQHIARVFNKG